MDGFGMGVWVLMLGGGLGWQWEGAKEGALWDTFFQCWHNWYRCSQTCEPISAQPRLRRSLSPPLRLFLLSFRRLAHPQWGGGGLICELIAFLCRIANSLKCHHVSRLEPEVTNKCHTHSHGCEHVTYTQTLKLTPAPWPSPRSSHLLRPSLTWRPPP